MSFKNSSIFVLISIFNFCLSLYLDTMTLRCAIPRMFFYLKRIWPIAMSIHIISSRLLRLVEYLRNLRMNHGYNTSKRFLNRTSFFVYHYILCDIVVDIFCLSVIKAFNLLSTSFRFLFSFLSHSKKIADWFSSSWFVYGTDAFYRHI